MKLIKNTLPFFCLLFVIASCNSTPTNEKAKLDSTMVVPKTDSVKYTVAMVDNSKDPTCGMPVGAGIEDTLHYNNKAIGFCSKECKDDFVKNAAKGFAAIEWKK